MKRIILIILICILSGSFATHAQNRGGTVTASSMVVTRTKIKNPIKIRWQNNIDVTVSEHYQLSYTGGWRFGNFFYFGFGTGVQYYTNVIPWDENGSFEIADISEEMKDINYAPSKIAVPIYAQLRFRFLKTRVSPYLSATGGLVFQTFCAHEGDYKTGSYYKDGIEGLYYADVFVGIDVRLKNDSSISLGLGPIFTGQDENYLSSEGFTRAIGGFKLGYSF